MKYAKTKADNVFSKAIFIDGKKVGGVQAVNVNYDIKKVLTNVTLRLVIKRNSLKIRNRRGGQQHIEFSTVNEAFK